MLKHLVPIVAATLLLLIVWAASVPLFHWFEVGESSDEMAEYQTLWQSHGIDSYEFIIQKDCICGPPGNIPVRIVVRDSLNIVAVDSRSSRNPPGERIEGIPHSVPDLFMLIRSAAADSRSPVIVTYDQQFGFPEQIVLNQASNDEIRYLVSQFRVISGVNQ